MKVESSNFQKIQILKFSKIVKSEKSLRGDEPANDVSTLPGNGDGDTVSAAKEEMHLIKKRIIYPITYGNLLDQIRCKMKNIKFLDFSIQKQKF